GRKDGRTERRGRKDGRTDRRKSESWEQSWVRRLSFIPILPSFRPSVLPSFKKTIVYLQPFSYLSPVNAADAQQIRSARLSRTAFFVEGDLLGSSDRTRLQSQAWCSGH